MLKIRFLRKGKKRQPFYKIVVTDKRKPPKGGNFKEQVGFYNPLTKEKAIKKDRIEYWISKGAQLSDTVHNLLVKEGVIKKSKIDVHKKPSASAKATADKEKKDGDKKEALSSVAPAGAKEEKTTEEATKEEVKEKPKEEVKEEKTEEKKEEPDKPEEKPAETEKPTEKPEEKSTEKNPNPNPKNKNQK